MKKLIKLSDTHYIVVDNSEIKEGDKFYCITNKVIFTAHTIEYLEEYNKLEDSNHNFYVNSKYAQKITHSTQPLEKIEGHPVKGGELWTCDKIKPLSLSEVEEAINGYGVEKMAEIDWIHKEYGFEEGYNPKRCIDGAIQKPKFINGYIKGFKAHKELVKDKLFTIEDIVKPFGDAFTKFINEGGAIGSSEEWIQWQNVVDWFPKYIQSLLPKTEWNIEFDEQGKIKLI